MIDWVADADISAGTNREAYSAPSVRVNVPTRTGLMTRVAERLRARQGFTLATLNLDHIVKLRQSSAFARAYAQHSFVVADGNPIVWLSRLAGRKVELMPGSELIAPLCALAAEMDAPVALLGSTPETLALSAERLQQAYPGLKVVAQLSPEFGFDPESAAADEMLDRLAQSGAQMCFLALGAPKQEILAARGYSRVSGCGFVSIGAGLDFIAGHQTRAPRMVRKLALEWLWRMLSNPRRLAHRYGLCLRILPGLALQALQARPKT